MLFNMSKFNSVLTYFLGHLYFCRWFSQHQISSQS